MKNFSKQEKIAAYQLLTPAEKDTIFSNEIGDKIIEIARKYSITEADIKNFRFTIGLYMLKLVPLNDLPTLIADRFPGKPVPEIISDIKAMVLPEIERVKAEYKPDPEDETANESASSDTQVNAISKPIKSPYREDIIDRDELLKQIEDPITMPAGNASEEKPAIVMPPSTGNPVEDRLKGIVFTPKETKQVVVEAPKAPEDQQKTAISTALPKIAPTYTGSDPYREPLA